MKKSFRESERQCFDKHFSKCNDSKQMFQNLTLFAEKKKDQIEMTSDELNDFFC